MFMNEHDTLTAKWTSITPFASTGNQPKTITHIMLTTDCTRVKRPTQQIVSRLLFDSIITNSTRPLHILLPPKVEKHYSTRPRGHCYQLPRKTSALDENNFFYRLLYRDIYRLILLIDIFICLVVTAVRLFFIKELQQQHFVLKSFQTTDSTKWKYIKKLTQQQTLALIQSKIVLIVFPLILRQPSLNSYIYMTEGNNYNGLSMVHWLVHVYNTDRK